MDWDSPKRSTYTSPTLKFLFKKLTYFIQPRTRSILTKLTYGMGPTSEELPNQLVLQTGHRNTLAKSVQCMQVDLLLRPANTDLVPKFMLLPRWTTVPKDSPNQPPQEFTRQHSKDIC